MKAGPFLTLLIRELILLPIQQPYDSYTAYQAEQKMLAYLRPLPTDSSLIYKGRSLLRGRNDTHT